MSTPVTSVGAAHEVIISILVLLLVLYVMVEVAGVSSTLAEWILLILVGALLLRGLSGGSSVPSWLSQYPWIPGSPASPPSKG